MKTNAEKLPSPWVSAIPLAVLTGLLYVVIRAFGGEAINGGSQIALLSATSVCVMLSIGIYRCRWAVLEEAIIDNIRASASAIIILLLIGAWFTAIGIFASSMTGSQIISGIITIGLLVLIFFMGLIPVVWGEFPAAGIFHYMSCSEHLDRFSAGLVDTRPVIFYLTMTVLTLAVTIRIIDHRRWKH